MIEKALFETLTSGNLATQFGTFNNSQIQEARKVLRDGSPILQFARFLIEEYPFEQLKLTDESKRENFSFTMAQCWLFTRTIFQDSRLPSFLNCFASPLSVVINSEYELQINEVAIIEKLSRKNVEELISPAPSKKPINYDQRLTHWEFLGNLNDAPICELKTLVLVANAMSTQTRLLEFSRISGDKLVSKGVQYLQERGMLVIDTPKENLLSIFPVKVLKKYANEQGINKIPSRKDALINVIKENCDPQKTLSFVSFLISDPQYGHGYAKERFMQPIIPNGKIFQEYVRNELNRLALYLESISSIEHDHHTVVSPVIKRNKSGMRPGDPYREYGSYENKKRYFSAENSIKDVSPIDLLKIQKYWDQHCNTLLEIVIAENPNSFPVAELVSEVMSYWNKNDELEKYKADLQNETHETHWHWLLNSYATYLLGLDEKYQLSSLEQKCSGCGKVFKEFSIPLDIALKVCKNIEFCSRCYHFIFNHRFMSNTTKAFRIPEQKMLDYLFELSKALGFIPTRTYMENIELPTQTKNQIAVGNILLKIPAYDIYIEKFGEWYKSLSLAGVLDSGHRKMGRGIQCMANDGHLCLSLGEKAIDDWLTEHGIAHEKEVFYPFDEKLNPNELSRTDWNIGNIYIEYAGLMNIEEYANKMNKKIQLAKKNNLQLIVIEPKDLFNLDEILKNLI
ncbi:MAG: hypothetical protein P1S60_01095 [Anaerolineae bacterium]|nr:hypothetical protein [Anaerolineae bacterium]